jgi:hypothetical protein
MVYVPQGEFYIGDGRNTNTNNFSNGNNSGTALKITAAMQAAGLPTTKLTERSYRAEELRKTEQYYSNTEKNITHSFTKAAKENNTNAMQRAQEEFMQLQNQRAANGFTRQPMSTLYKSAQAQRKREQSLVGGVETTKQNVQHERELANE